MKTFPVTSFRTFVVLGLSLVAASLYGQEFEVLFDGQSMKGWHISAKSGHSKVSGNQTGGNWVIEDGAIVGSQDMPGNGGFFMTDEEFGDFEIVLEMNNDFGPDSGLFLRSTETARAYQALIDYRPRGSLMGMYGEGLGEFSSRNFVFEDSPDRIRAVSTPGALPLAVLPESWKFFWRHGQWNELRARVVGNPPTITTWINGVKFMEFVDTEKRLPDKGRIGLQMHGNMDLSNRFVRYRNIRIKRLAPVQSP